MLGWIFSKRAKSEQFRQSDRTERNAVIRRIVTAAAETTQKRVDRTADGTVIGPFTAVANAADEPATSGNIPRDQIAERAYEIWVRNGRPTGTADRDWLEAARELAAEIAPAPQ